MNIFDSLGKLYHEIDSEYAKNEVKAGVRGHNKLEQSIFEKRQLNDQAYFLFMFSRLEDRVRELSTTIIDKNLRSKNWNSKKSWEIIKQLSDRDNLNFINRVSLLTSKGGKDYNLIKSYYDQRNKIAHGGTFSVSISIPKVIIDMKRLYKELK